MRTLIEDAAKKATALSLAAIVMLAMPDRANAADTPVKVDNTAAAPVLTRATDNPALQFFQAEYTVNVASGATTGITRAAYTVPAGKRLVIQTVSAYVANFSSPPTPQTTQVYVNIGNCSFAVPPIVNTGASEYPGTTLSAVFYADQTTQVTFASYRSGTTGNENDDITVSGYLVTLPPS